jgi:Bacteriophage Mu, GemA protein
MLRDRGAVRREDISKQQIRAIWALCHRLGLDEQSLHGLAQAITGVSSIRQLSSSQATRLIDLLLAKTGFKTRDFPRRPGFNTPHQLAYIQGLAAQLGWDEPHTLGLARRMYHVRRLRDLGIRQASGLIEALKAIQERKAS